MVLAARLRNLAGNWMADVHMVEEVLEKLVVEQLVNTMPAELRIWVAERKPKTGLEAGRLADDYLQACRNVRQGTRDMKKERGTSDTSEPRRCHHCGSADYFKRDCPVKESSGAGNNSKNSKSKPVKCFNCRNYGHMPVVALNLILFLGQPLTLSSSMHQFIHNTIVT